MSLDWNSIAAKPSIVCAAQLCCRGYGRTPNARLLSQALAPRKRTLPVGVDELGNGDEAKQEGQSHHQWRYPKYAGVRIPTHAKAHV